MANKNFKYQLLAIILIGLAQQNFLLAQRPKIGLVLSGGGAKGMAHIGILRAIDSAGLKIDYVTGTSMGSIMGAMYAVGYSGRQIDSISRTLDWDVLLTNKPAYSDVSIDEKDEYSRYAVEVGIKDLKPQLGTGLIESEELWLKLSEVFFPVFNVKDFSKFNIPFKCVATDLGSGKAVVWSKGEITKALRSSMAIPSVFSAISHEEKMLVDGGIVRNFPVEDAKNMGADIVIGVNLFSGLTKTKDINTALDIMYQITQYRDAEDLIKEKRLCNLVIEPEVSQYSAGSFESTDSIVKIGIEFGKLYYPYFKRLADSLSKIYPEKYNPQNRLPKLDSTNIEAIEISGLSNSSRSMLVHKLNINTNESYTASQLNSSFRAAYSTRYYNKIIYSLEPITGNRAKLKCELIENPLISLKFGLSYHSYTGAGIIANITHRNLLFDKSRTMLKVSLGENIMALAQHKQALGKALNSIVTISYLYQSLPFPIFDSKKLSIQKYLYRFSLNQFDINYKRLLGKDATIGVGLSALSNYFSPDISAVGSFNGNVKNNYAYLNFELNTLNRRFFPTKGSNIYFEIGYNFNRKLELSINNSDSNLNTSSGVFLGNFQRVNLSATKYLKVTKRLSTIQTLNIFAQNQYTGFLIDNVFVGGVQQIFNFQVAFAGLKEGQLASSSISSVQFGAQYKAFGELYVLGRINGGVYGYSTTSKIFDPEKLSKIFGGSLGLGYNLSAMPMEFTMMYSPQVNKLYGHVRIGFLF